MQFKQVLITLFRTYFTQQATISAGSLVVAGWSSILEEFSLRRFQQNADFGRIGFTKVLERFHAANST